MLSKTVLPVRVPLMILTISKKEAFHEFLLELNEKPFYYELRRPSNN